MPGSAVHGRLRVWSVSGLSIAVAVAWGPTAALADTGGSPGARESGNRTGRRQCRDGQFARRRESQYLLATGGYTEQWR